MVLYGMLALRSIGNLLKPFIISRSNHLPFVLTLMSVIGGMFAFGVTGVFLGPALLALAINLGVHWLEGPQTSPEAPDGVP